MNSGANMNGRASVLASRRWFTGMFLLSQPPDTRYSSQPNAMNNRQLLIVVTLALVLGSQLSRTAPARAPSQTSASPYFNVRDQGAMGDGTMLDTAAIQTALDRCAQAGGGQVYFPPGRYLSGTLHLRSHITLFLEAGATLVGTTNLAEYQSPNPQTAPSGFRWGKWYRALLLGENVRDITLCGPGTIDGNKVFDPTGEERMRGPHTVVLSGCRGFNVRNLTFIDSANYAIFFLATDDVDIRNVKFIGGWDGIHWRGTPDRWCHNVTITDCEFYTGDDALAGRYWDNTLISSCVVNSSCNGLRLIGPARNLIVNDCLFFGPGRQPHRTSGERRRTNMLCGILLQPGAWDATTGPLEDVLLSNITMSNVDAPVALWTKPGNTADRITIDGLRATGVYLAALSLESWDESPLGQITVRDATVEFAGGATNAPDPRQVKPPGVGSRPLPTWGLYARNLERLTLDNVRLRLSRDDARPAVLIEDVQRLDVEQVTFSPVEGVSKPVISFGVGETKGTFRSTYTDKPQR